jgi:hypothetical protein
LCKYHFKCFLYTVINGCYSCKYYHIKFTWLTTPTTITIPGWPHPRFLQYLVDHTHDDYITWLTTPTTITIPGWTHQRRLHCLVDHTHDFYITWLTTPTTITLPGWPHPRLLHYLVDHTHDFYITWLTTPTTITFPGLPHPQLLHYLVDNTNDYYITWLTTPTTITLPGWPQPRLLQRSPWQHSAQDRKSPFTMNLLVLRIPFTHCYIDNQISLLLFLLTDERCNFLLNCPAVFYVCVLSLFTLAIRIITIFGEHVTKVSRLHIYAYAHEHFGKCIYKVKRCT